MSAIAILLIAFGLMLGFYSFRRASQKLLRVLLVAAFLPVLISVGMGSFNNVSQEQKLIIVIIILVVGIFIALRLLLGREAFGRLVFETIWGAVKAVLVFPFKVIAFFFKKYI
ncbi:MAG: hypothetical protein HQK96_09410 [Nitrospirae bacterium]|nr:hypothetical protein [Nitrospirota bacterium]